MSTKVDPTEKAISQNSIVLKLCIIIPQIVASLQYLVNKHPLKVPPVFNGLILRPEENFNQSLKVLFFGHKKK